jgi:hypothetical protein
MNTAALGRTLDYIGRVPRILDARPGYHTFGEEHTLEPGADIPLGHSLGVIALALWLEGHSLRTDGTFTMALRGDSGWIPLDRAAADHLGVTDETELTDPVRPGVAALKGTGRADIVVGLMNLLGRTPASWDINQQLANDIIDLLESTDTIHRQSRWFTRQITDDGDDGVNTVLRPGDDPTECGTTLCIAGAACHLTGWTLKNQHSTLVYKGDVFFSGDPASVAQTQLNLPTYIAEKLFYNTHNDSAMRLLYILAGRPR